MSEEKDNIGLRGLAENLIPFSATSLINSIISKHECKILFFTTIFVSDAMFSTTLFSKFQVPIQVSFGSYLISNQLTFVEPRQGWMN